MTDWYKDDEMTWEEFRREILREYGTLGQTELSEFVERDG